MSKTTSKYSTPQSPEDLANQADLMARGQIPTHIAIIMDGNGRWAKAQGKNRVIGHKEGVKSVKDAIETCDQLGVKCLTLYTFSTENWNRPAYEVTALMALLVQTIRKEVKGMKANNIRLTTMGDITRLPKAGQREIAEAMRETENCTGLILNLALSYGSRHEIVRGVKNIAQAVKDGKISVDDINDDLFSDHLYSRTLPDPDLMIRTSGEFRLSNFMLWQFAYTEFYITEDYWPAFRRNQLYKAIESFQDRDRRFGRVSEDN